MDARLALLAATVFGLAAAKALSHSNRLSDVRVFSAHRTLVVSFVRTLRFHRQAARGFAIHDRLFVRRERLLAKDFALADCSFVGGDDGQRAVCLWPVCDRAWSEGLWCCPEQPTHRSAHDVSYAKQKHTDS